MGLKQDELERQRNGFKREWKKRFAIRIDDVIVDDFLKAIAEE